MKQLWAVLSLIALIAGFLFLFFSFFLPPQSVIHTVSLGLGVSLLPTGIISIITSLSSSKVVEENIRKELGVSTADLKTSINNLKETSIYLNKSKDLGVVMVYENRGQALEPFLDHLEEYVKRGITEQKKEFVFVGSSLKGVIEDDPKYAAQLERILSQAKGKCDCKFLLTHPFYSKFRETQEDRPPGGIAMEILHAIAWLEEKGVPQSNIKVYKGTPTCFMIASTERMIINPYPYQREAYRSFCLELENTESERSVYYSFWTNHYYKPWYGEEKRKDHFILPNALSYVHDALDGPVPPNKTDAGSVIEPCADFFVIKDTGSFYLAVNVRGLETDIPYNRKSDGSCNIIQVGKTLSVKLLDLSEKKDIWQTVGTIELSDIRNGFWHATPLGCKSINAYTMIGVFDDQHPGEFVFENANPLLDGKPLPILWKWLLPHSNSLQVD